MTADSCSSAASVSSSPRPEGGGTTSTTTAVAAAAAAPASPPAAAAAAAGRQPRPAAAASASASPQPHRAARRAALMWLRRWEGGAMGRTGGACERCGVHVSSERCIVMVAHRRSCTSGPAATAAQHGNPPTRLHHHINGQQHVVHPSSPPCLHPSPSPYLNTFRAYPSPPQAPTAA